MYCTGKTTNAQESHTSNRKQLMHRNLTLQTVNNQCTGISHFKLVKLEMNCVNLLRVDVQILFLFEVILTVHRR